jgi:glycosyltransferase involved in cell wall biosynthesis
VKPKVVLVSNTSWYIYNFRRGLVVSLRERGFEVCVVTPSDEYSPRLVDLGCKHFPITMDNKGSNPIRDAMTILDFYRLYGSIKPHLIYQNTIKPNIYGSIAAGLLGIPVINTITGLGTAFLKDDLRQKLVRMLYRISQRGAFRIFFQNEEDQRMFVQAGLVPAGRDVYIPGSGVDLQRFDFKPLAERSSLRFLLIARLLRDKGVVEYVEAARMLKRKYPEAEFQLLGFLDADNHSAVSREEVDQWVAEGVVNYLGKTDNVVPFMEAADCVVLPSYREGLPKTLIEAAAVGRPLVATDVVGCRDVVKDGFNGFLCEAKSAQSLADALERMLGLSLPQRQLLADNGRRFVEENYDERLVIRKYMACAEQLVQPGAWAGS